MSKSSANPVPTDLTESIDLYPLEYWPFSQNLLLDVANRALVEAHAYFLLSRALNLGKVVVTTGSGVSASYGRTSWAELTQRIANHQLEASEKSTNAQILTMRQKLTALLQQKEKNYYTIFHVADRLNKKLRMLQSAAGKAESEITPSMRSVVKELTANDQGHLQNLFQAATGEQFQTDGKTHSKLKMNPIRWKEVPERVRSKIGITKDDLEKPVPPYLRVAYAIDDQCANDARRANQKSGEKENRSAFVQQARDPLAILLRQLRIRRFMTYNYDAEIERLFRDEGYRQRAGDKSAWIRDNDAIDPSAAIAEVTVFSSKKIGELTRFAVRDRSRDVQVVYLHGRAYRKSEVEQLVVSEEDYQRAYVSNSDSQHTIDEALNVAYGANAVLFVGVGMTEDDVLRQLRELTASPTRLQGTSCFALMPAFGKDKANVERLRLLHRFGVYVIHYGIFDEHYILEDLDTLKFCWEERIKSEELAKEPASLSEDQKKALIRLKNETFQNKVIERLKKSKIEIDTEWKLLGLAIDKLLEKEQIGKHKRFLVANINDAFQNALLCDALFEIDRQKVDWRKDWTTLPTALQTVISKMAKLGRHIPVIINEPNAEFRFHHNIPSPTFQRFLRDLKRKASKRTLFFKPRKKQVVFDVIADRGIGRGHFLSAFWQRQQQVEDVLRTVFKKAFYASITHSTEIFSAFDQLIGYANTWTSNNRLIGLEKALAQSDLLIVINGYHVLFNADGSAKNSQIARIDQLLRSDSVNATVFLLGLRGKSSPANSIQLHIFDPILLACNYFPTVLEVLVTDTLDLSTTNSAGGSFSLQAARRAELAKKIFSPGDQRAKIEKLIAADQSAHEEALKGLFGSNAKLEKTQLLVSLAERLCNRYLYSLVLAACESDVGSGKAACFLDFIQGCAQLAENRQSSSGQMAVIDRVFQEYEDRHRRVREPFSFRIRLNQNKYRDFSIQRVILWHLSIIGQPVIVDVLQACPLISRLSIENSYFNDLLDEMVERCLVMRILPRGDSQEESSDVRYGVHRLMQQYIFANIGNAEYSKSDQYTLSLYASQPNDLPVLSPLLHADLRDTISALAAFPNGLNEPLLPKAQNKDRSQLVAVRRLRAALAILRSIYSVAACCRFDKTHMAVLQDRTGERIPFLDDHRHLVQWVYQQAKMPKYAEVFYAEELAWLCNEVGVISFIQGRTNDALSLYDLASKATRHFETSKQGSVNVRIRLNRCIAEIERGSLIASESELKEIVEIADETKPLLAVTRGYLGLIAHLRGRQKEAEENYKKALYSDNGLLTLGRSRAASIFTRHLSDLYRSQRLDIPSREKVSDALVLAEEGGHEDIRYSALASQIRWHLFFRNELSAIPAKCAELQQYAEMMGMPRLLAETLELRARYRRAMGDDTEARRLAMQALQIASLNDLRLRKAGILVLLGQIHASLGNRATAVVMARSAMETARRTDHFLPLAEASSLLVQLDAQIT